MQNKRILIIGAAGSIGSALADKIYKYNPEELILFDQDETGIFNLEKRLPNAIGIIGNIRDEEALETAFRNHKPHIVIQAAAYKHVGLMERFPLEAHKNNVGGTKNVLEVAKRYNTKFILISTDKAVDPESIMGKSKKQCEDLTLQNNGTVVRFGNVAASRGSVVPIFKDQIDNNEPITVTDKNMTRYFMGIYEAAGLVIKAIELSEGGEIFILDMGDPIKIYDLAKMMVKLSGKDIPIIEIGKRKGEKISENLMTDEERRRAKKIDSLWIIK